MESATKHKIPLITQLILALSWYLLLFLMSAKDNGSDISDALNNNKYIVFLKIAQAIIVILVFILPVIFFSVFARSEKINFLNINRVPKLNSIITAVTICIIALPAVSGMTIWNESLTLPESMSSLESWMRSKEDGAAAITKLFLGDRSGAALVLNLIVIALMAALSEEIFFRGLIQRLLHENKVNIHLSVWITAVLFSAFHFQFYGFVPRLFLGAILGYLYAFTNNLWVPILAHFANNAFAVIMVYSFDQAIDATLPGDMDGKVGLPVVLISISVVASQLWFLNRFNNRQLED